MLWRHSLRQSIFCGSWILGAHKASDILKLRAKASAPRASASRISCSQSESVKVPIYFTLEGNANRSIKKSYHVMEKSGCGLAVVFGKIWILKIQYSAYTGFPVLAGGVDSVEVEATVYLLAKICVRSIHSTYYEGTKGLADRNNTGCITIFINSEHTVRGSLHREAAVNRSNKQGMYKKVLSILYLSLTSCL